MQGGNVLQYLTFEFENDKEMQLTLKKLWEQYGVTGEVHIRPVPPDRWRVDLVSEKELRDSTLEKFSQFRVEVVGDD